MPVIQAAVLPADDVLRTLGSDRRGLTEDEVLRRRAAVGPNAVRSHHARPWAVLGRQLASPLLVLLLVTALVSFVVGEQTDAVIIGVILAASVGLGFVNEYRAERTAEALHSAVHHLVVVTREGAPRQVDVTELVPGDVVRLTLGAVVPADLRLMAVTGLECNESVLTGESAATTKRVDPVAEGTVLAELDSCALMGTVVTAGSGTGVVVATGGQAEFGRIAVGLGHRQPQTEFQLGLRRFSGLLLIDRSCADRLHPGHQPRSRATAAGLDPVLPCHRRRHHPAVAARRRQHQPGDRVAPHGPAEGAGEAAGLHRGPR